MASSALIRVLILVAIVVLSGFERTFAQTPGTKGHPSIELGGSAGGAGMGVFHSYGWGTVGTRIRNRSDADQELRTAIMFSDQPYYQFVRNAWVPAMASRTIEWPAFYNAEVIERGGGECETILLPLDSETQWDREAGLLRLQPRDGSSIAMVSDPEDDPHLDAVAFIKAASGLGKGLFFPHQLPRFEVSWDGLQALVLTRDDPKFDAAQRKGLRSWLNRGGVLWVFAEQVDTVAMEQVLGDEWDVTVVDNVTHSHFDLDVQPEFQPNSKPMIIESGDPIPMARVYAPSFYTSLAFQGWPVFAYKNVGKGKVVISTVSGRILASEMFGRPGVLEPRKEAEWVIDHIADTVFGDYSARLAQQRRLRNDIKARQSETAKARQADSPGRPAGMAGMTGMDTGSALMPPKIDAPSLREAQQQYVGRQVGYSVASRSTVGSVLILFVVITVVVTLVFRKNQRGELIAAIGGIAGVACSVILLVIGMANRGEVATTQSTVQVIDVNPGQRKCAVNGTFGLYDPSGVPMAVAGIEGGSTLPQLNGSITGFSRMVWGDIAAWRWENIQISPGTIRPFEFTHGGTLPSPLVTRLAFGPEGLAGTVTMPAGMTPASPFIATPWGNMLPESSVNGSVLTIKAASSGLLRRGEYLGAGDMAITSDLQNKNIMLAGIVDGSSGIHQPELLIWTDTGLPMHVVEQDGVDYRTSAIWRVPMTINTSPPGTSVTIPGPFMTMKPARVSDNTTIMHSPLYMAEHGGWLLTGQSTSFVAHFEAPRQVLPLKLTAATIALDITAISRDVTVSVIAGEQVHQVTILDGPDGSNSIGVPVEALHMSADGKLTLAVSVGDPKVPNIRMDELPQSLMWRINDMKVEVQGTVGQ